MDGTRHALDSGSVPDELVQQFRERGEWYEGLCIIAPPPDDWRAKFDRYREQT